MKFGKMLQLWILGMVLLASVLGYAADDCISLYPSVSFMIWNAEEGKFVPESKDTKADFVQTDFLTVSPSGDAPGIYEITISGTRNSDTASVVSHEVDIVHPWSKPCEIGVAGCDYYSKITVKATILRGKNPGRSTYEKRFKFFAEQGNYEIFFLYLDGEGVEQYQRGKIKGLPTSLMSVYYKICPEEDPGYDYGILSVTPKPSVNLSLQNATAEINGTDSFTLRNLAGETTDSQGVSQKFNAWGNFRWNPDTLSFELKDAGLQ